MLFCITGLLVINFSDVKAQGYESSREAESYLTEETENEEEMTGEFQMNLLADMDFSEIQNMLDEMLGNNSFSFVDTVKKLMNGEAVFSKETVLELVHGLFFSRIEKERGTLGKVLLLIIFSSVFANFAAVFDNGQIGEISFYVVYLLLFMMLMDSFSQMSISLHASISWMAEFMKGLAPAYFAAVSASSGALTAAAFYEGILLLVWLIQWLLLTFLLPGVNLYILLKMVNHLSREEMLGKMAELISTAVSWGMKTLLGMVAGLQVIRSLVTPVIDSLKRTALGKTASMIPGVGNAVNTVTELIITSAVLVRNSLGIVVFVVFLLVGAGPVIHYLVLSLSYRFLAAVSQPVSDKRLVECLSTMGEGCGFLLRILFTAEIMCMLTFLILMVSFQGGV